MQPNLSRSKIIENYEQDVDDDGNNEIPIAPQPRQRTKTTSATTSVAATTIKAVPLAELYHDPLSSADPSHCDITAKRARSGESEEDEAETDATVAAAAIKRICTDAETNARGGFQA